MRLTAKSTAITGLVSKDYDKPTSNHNANRRDANLFLAVPAKVFMATVLRMNFKVLGNLPFTMHINDISWWYYYGSLSGYASACRWHYAREQ